MNSEPLRILLTGGTGSFGQAFVRRCLARHADCMIRVFSRDELKQVEMARRFPNEDRLRFFIGDIRDRERLRRALTDVNLVVHAAAMKQVPACEYNPVEAVKTNVIGAMNLLDCSIDAGVARTLALSTDKAVNPANLYGATKLCMEKILIHGNVYSGESGTRFSVVRYGNVLGSRGSVIPLFRDQAAGGVITLTDRRMTRFWISLDQAVDFVQHCIDEMRGGETFVPKIPSMRLTDLARAICPDAVLKEVGIRDGEKLHEVLVTADEARRVVEYDTHFVIRGDERSLREAQAGGRQVTDGFEFSSDNNTQWLSVDRLRELARSEPAPANAS